MSKADMNNFSYILEGPCSTRPNHPAFIEIDGEKSKSRSYKELNENIDKIAGYFSSLGLLPETRIAICIGNRIEFIESLLGIMRAGFVPVPLNHKLGEKALEHILKDANCKAILIEPDINPHIKNLAENLKIETKINIDTELAGWIGFEDIVNSNKGFTALKTNPNGPAMQPYTSGSTGNPKGVILTHKGQKWFTDNFTQTFPQVYHVNSRALVAVPLFHKNAMAGAIKPLLKVGGTVILMRRFEPIAFLKALLDYKCTYSTGVPAMYSMLLEERDLISEGDFTSLEYLSIGSAPCAPALINEVQERFGARVLQGYGLTEGGPVVFEQPPDDPTAPIESCGRLLPNVEVKLLDDNGLINPHEGELWVRNEGVTPGYYNLPEVNKKRIIDGWLATGDLFRKDDKGFYYFLGRTDDLMISGGENIYPAEVEKILMRHKDILNICVVSLPHKTKGEVPGAVVVVTPNCGLTEEILKDFFFENGPPYAHPRLILIAAEMPLSGAGKIDRNQVSDLLLREWKLREGS